MKRNRVIWVAFLMIGLMVALISLNETFTFKQEAQSKQQKDEEEATIVKKGQVTDKEKEYSKEISKLYPYRKGNKFTSLIDRSIRLGKLSEEIRIVIPESEYVEDPDAPILSSKQFINDLSCSADLIIIGTLITKTSHLTEDETFVYTENNFTIKEILKNNSASPVEVNNQIEIVRPGGLIIFENRKIRIQDMSYENLKKNQSYLLFLNFVPKVNGYVVNNPKGDFILDKNSLKSLSKYPIPKELREKNQSQNLLNDFRNFVSIECTEVKK